MARLFREMVQTLQQAMASLDNELEALSKAEVIDQTSLQRHAEVSADSYSQAEGLLEMMADRDADPELMREAEELAAYFEDTALRLEHLAQAVQS